MTRLEGISIKQKLSLILVGISLISVIITTIALTIIGIFNLRQNLQDELNISAEIVGQRNLAALLFYDPEFATTNLEVYSSQPSVTRACLYDEIGKLFAQYSAQKTDARNCQEHWLEIKSGSEYFSALQPIKDKNHEIVGNIFVESDRREIDKYVENQIVMACIVVLTVMVIAYILALFLRSMISRPILQLADLSHQISSKKDFSLRAPHVVSRSKNRNEILKLYRAFNTMLTEIDAREKQLLAKNEELLKAKDAAEEANRSKSEFLANVSHELRTPLNAIIGFSSIIMNQLFGKLGNEKYNEYAQDINESGVHLLDIINDILDLSKAEAGKLTLTFEEVNIPKTVKKCITLISKRAHEEEITITTDVPANLPPLIADRLRLIQVLLNILSNAVKFTDSGGKVHIAVKTSVTDGEVTDFLISVEDTGIGMTPDEIEKSYQTFGQIDSGLNRKYEGTGLGLPLARKLMELHHGKIRITSEKGVGTRVNLHFLANPVYVGELGDTQPDYENEA
jgi:signal transduction histidine kinase